MDSQITNPFGSYQLDQGIKKEQTPKKIKRIIFIFIIVLVVVLLFIFLDTNKVGQEYVKWVQSVFSRLNFLKAGVTLNLPFSEKSEINSSQINFENLLSEKNNVSESENEKNQTEEIIEIPQKTEVIVSKSQTASLENIQKEINNIKEKTDKIEQEVIKLKVLIGIQESIRKISIEVNKISQEIQSVKI